MMNITEKIDNYLNESTFKAGDWISQARKGVIEYAILIEPLKNKAWSVVSIDSDRKVASKKSTKGWYPAPKAINSKDVPAKLKDKVMKKLQSLGIGHLLESRKIINDILKKGKKIAVNPLNKEEFYFDVDGTTWFVSQSGSLTNHGDTKDFIKSVKNNKYRAKLLI